MTSNETQDDTASGQESETTYSTDAVYLVRKGYRRFQSKFAAYLRQEGMSPNTTVKEVIEKISPDQPLLLPKELVKFYELTGMSESHDVLTVIWNVLEESCEERRLMPFLGIDKEHGELIVTLH